MRCRNLLAGQRDPRVGIPDLVPLVQDDVVPTGYHGQFVCLLICFLVNLLVC